LKVRIDFKTVISVRHDEKTPIKTKLDAVALPPQ
jgi:hypothetical protein